MDASRLTVWVLIGLASLPTVRFAMKFLRVAMFEREAKNYSTVFEEGPKKTLLGSAAAIGTDDMTNVYAAGHIFVPGKKGAAPTLVRQAKVTDDDLTT